MNVGEIESFDFMEARLLGISLGENNSEGSLTFVDTSSRAFSIQLQGIDRLWVDSFREQNVVESFEYWANGRQDGLREAVFHLIAGKQEIECSNEQRVVAESLLEAICRGELAMLSLTAIYGAGLLATFQKMELAFI